MCGKLTTQGYNHADRFVYKMDTVVNRACRKRYENAINYLLRMIGLLNTISLV